MTGRLCQIARAFALLSALAPAAIPARPHAQPAPAAVAAATARSLALDVNKSHLVHLDRPARDVLVVNPAIADVVLRTAETAFVIAKKIGETDVYFFDGDGHAIDALDVNVTFDSDAVAQALRRAIPNEQIDVSTANQSIVLSGSVASQQVAANAGTIARQFVTDDKSIINLLKVRDRNQVVLRVRVTEMERTAVKELGITPGFPAPFSFNIGGLGFAIAGNAPAFVQTPFFGLYTGPGAQGSTLSPPPVPSPFPGAPAAPSSSFAALLQALEANGLVRTLAEPTLTAVSGETASFLVGGKFPLPTVVGVGASAQIVPVFYPFGVQLTFTPVVLSSGLISLKIATSVSATGAPTTVGGTSVPSLTERSATTTVELPSGDGVAIAGLLQNDIQTTIQGLPGLMNLPVLGALFSSKQFQHDETELVIALSAYLVRPVDPNALAYPSDGFGPASDFNLYFLGRLNATRLPRGANPPPPKGPFGFILE
ncbi:MAG TPA: type II and III secretion system protein family protein [Stellaceae bacterium]|nr:type II and III secretion system protein family protein [Stellaceae bacterium]